MKSVKNGREQAYAKLIKAAKSALFVLRMIPTPEFPKPGHLDGILVDEIANILEAALNNPDLAQIERAVEEARARKKRSETS